MLARVRAGARVSVRVCVRVCVYVSVYVYVRMRMCVLALFRLHRRARARVGFGATRLPRRFPKYGA